MKIKLLVSAAVLSLLGLAALPSRANICTVPPIHTNGCTTKLQVNGQTAEIGYFYPSIVPFKVIYESACNRHDICYSTLGSDKSQCDSEFRGNMRSRCDSVFNRWLDPAGWQYCKNMAEQFYTAVHLFGQEAETEAKNETVTKSIGLRAAVESDQCGMTAQLAGYYTSDITGYVEGAFQQRAARRPTVFEMFNAIHSGNPGGDLGAWRLAVDSYAQSRRTALVPSINVMRSVSWDQVEFSSSATPVGSPVTMRINGVGYGAAASFSLDNHMYNSVNYSFRGFASARHAVGGEREIQLIDFSIYRQAECNPICR